MRTLVLLLTLLFCSCSCGTFAQVQSTIYYSKKYLDLNIRSLSKYSKRIGHQQQHLLKKLKKKEHRFAKQLKRKDSSAFARLQQPLTYDSISRMLRPDSNTLAQKTLNRRNPIIDSLKSVKSLLQSKTNNTIDMPGYDSQLGRLQQQLNYQQYINGLIDRRTASLKNLSGTLTQSPTLNAIGKDVLYGKAKMNVWKQVANDPSIAEEKALEYLQGTEGFSFNNNSSAMQDAASVDDLEKMGYQTKRQLNKQLQEKFGNSLGQVQQQMGSQVSEWQKHEQGLDKEIKQAKQEAKGAKADFEETRQSLANVKNLRHNSFKQPKGNPMRGLPFWKRIEKSYDFQTTRGTADDKQPAMLQLAATAGYKQTPTLSYGVGLATSIGLGQDWSHIHLSWRGIGVRSYATYEMIFGIAAYAGYERFWKKENTTNSTEQTSTISTYNTHNTSAYNESVMLGISKQYKINSKWNGAVQVLYDVWWREKGLNSPLILRFVTTSK